MRDVTEKWREVVAGGHRVAQKVELLYGGEVVTDLTEQGVVADGSVVAASSSAVMRSGSCLLVDEEGVFLPGTGAGLGRLLAPAGSELRLWRGIDYHDTSPELVPVGTMRFISNDVEPPRMSLELFDRAWAISQAGLTGNLAIAAGTPVTVTITRLLTAAYGPRLETNFPDTDEVVTNLLFDPGDDPWARAQELAANIGQRLYFDPLGVATMTPEPNPLTDPVVWSFDDRDPRNLQLPGGRERWEGTAPNLIVAIGENTDNTAIYRGVATDTDANSLTRYGGPYGRIHQVIRDEKIASQEQANFRARTVLYRGLGLIRQPSMPILPNAALEPGDIVLSVRARWGLGHLCVLEGFTLPLRANQAMPLECRERHVTELDAA